ncbi:MAG: histidine phosphatase family protein [Treponema sp.]|nr:histidine phosphatase family protein [Treponema sp.]
MRIVLIRHGDPDYEKDCLTEKGHKQAEIAAQRLLQEEIEEIYSSPLGRAKETAGYFSKASGIKEIQILNFMQEIRFGQEGALYDNRWNPWLGVYSLVNEGYDLMSPDWREYPVFKDNFATEDADKIGLETDKWLANFGYIREGLYYRNKRPDDRQKTIAIFCHGGASAAFLARVLNQQFPYMCGVLLNFPHTTITVLKFDDTPNRLTLPIIELMNDARHLNNLKDVK